MSERLLAAAGDIASIPERFDPATMKGQIIEAEHLARYRWACALVDGRRVLDAGCGTAYGSTLLARAGAAEVIGVDVAEDVLERARVQVPSIVELEAADVTQLPFADARFDVVVCFEVIEHVEDRDTALDELRRVLDPDGVLVISSPNRDVYPGGNPHHVHEYTPAEFLEALSARFAVVRLERQHTWITSAVLDDEAFMAGGDEELPTPPRVRKLIHDDPGAELYTVALAGQRSLPSTTPTLEVAPAVELRKWDELWHEQAEVLTSQARILAEYDASRTDLAARGDESRDEINSLRSQLLLAEAAGARMVELEGEIENLLALNDELIESHRELRSRDEGLDELVAIAQRYATVVDSTSWRLTRPLRRVMAAFRKIGG
jgi:O-antigen biosynthesis protein